ncbi:hypothetical protein NKJ09_23005 [Mesorhizobium sp. M0189]|uniref:hypothetical protein n=1 Tax=Mesorhizobium sp. M0189 TaxID=2956909 RepID=UPI00333BBA1F
MARYLNHYECTDCDVEWSDEWSCQCDDECPNCGHDFSPVESEDLDEEGDDEAECACCHGTYGLDELDSKPTMTRWLRIIRLSRGQRFMLQYAADHGYDFDRLECKSCYGAGFKDM